MRKLLCILTVFALGLLILGMISSPAGANRSVFDRGTQDELELAKQISMEVLRRHAAERAIGAPDDFIIKRVEIDDLKMAHTHVQQVVGGVPVWGGEAIIHLKPNGELFTITDDLKESVFIDTKPNFSSGDADREARSIYKGSDALTEEPRTDLWIFRGDERDHLAYRVQMRREDGTKDTAMPVIFIDAHTGEKVFEYDNLQTGTGSSLYSGTVTIGTNQSGSTYYMENLTRFAGTFNYNNGTSSVSRFSDADDVWNSTVQRAGVDAQFGMEAMLNYLQNVHGRNGIDGSGGPRIASAGSQAVIQSRVHYSSNYNNAFWNGSYMTYGDGNGSTFSPLVTIDICGHEMMHGVTERTAGLIYSGQSGALNESFSDVFGTLVERYARPSNWNWRIGEDAYTPANGTSDALRYMDDPHAATNGGYTADDDPDHYAERYTGTADNGGVHINSGIGNKAFYLVATGGTHHRSGVTVSGIGPDNAGRIWYRALTSYMTSSTNFSGARTATLNAASAIFGSSSAQYNTVATAWCAVGVGTCPGPTPTPTPTASPTPTPTPGGELLVNPGFEGSVSPWVKTSTGAYWNSSGYPHSGSGYITMGYDNSVTGTIYQTVTIPSNAAGNLTFWLNVTSDEGPGTVYDRLYVEVRSTSGALLATLATYSNLNEVATPGAYTQRGTFSLAAYRGQTVRLQFRAVTDSSLRTWFRVDDVSLR